MSNLTGVVTKVPIEIQNRSGFDLSHENIGTSQPGTLTPVLSKMLQPGDRVSLGAVAELSLPPLATNAYGRVDYKLEAFFVPARIILGDFKKFFVYKNDGAAPGATNDFTTAFKKMPVINCNEFEYLKPGSLLDYLGYGVRYNEEDYEMYTIKNPLPIFAYHKIWDDWYRASLIQTPCFDESSPEGDRGLGPGRAPYIRFSEYASYFGYDPNGPTEPSDVELFNGHHFLALHQRNYSKDYFTNATPRPQYGAEASLRFTVSNNSGEFTISSLRSANSLQKFLERNNLSARYEDQIYNRYGVTPSDSAIDHALFLGRAVLPVYARSVSQTAQVANNSSNPFKTVGSVSGNMSGFGDGSLIENFEATEPGVLMVIGSLVPHAIYGSGISRYLMYESLADFPDPILATIGDQPILRSELSLLGPSQSQTFGYTQRYAEARYALDECHGELRDGASLSSFAIKRSFEDAVLGSEFLEIPTSALDEILAVDSDMAEFGYWYDINFVFKKSSILPAYSIPTLGEPKDTHTILTDKGGKML